MDRDIPVKSVLHKLKKRSDIVLTSLEDAKKYMIGTTRNAAGHHSLINSGFEEGKQFELVSSNELSVRKLFAERVDLESSVDLNFIYEAKRIGRSYADVEQVWVLFENEVYVAFSQSIPDAVVERLRTIFERIRMQGTVDAIIEKYMNMYQ